MKLKSLIYLYIYLFWEKSVSHQIPLQWSCSTRGSSPAHRRSRLYAPYTTIYHCRHTTPTASDTTYRKILYVGGLICPSTDINTSHKGQITFHLYKGNVKWKGSGLQFSLCCLLLYITPNMCPIVSAHKHFLTLNPVMSIELLSIYINPSSATSSCLALSEALGGAGCSLPALGGHTGTEGSTDLHRLQTPEYRGFSRRLTQIIGTEQALLLVSMLCSIQLVGSPARADTKG